MRTFTDTAGRSWNVELNTTAVKNVRTLLGVNLMSVLDDNCKLLAQLYDDPVLLVDVLYCVCREQAQKLDVSDEDFGRAMAGDAIEHAAVALTEELADFFRTARQRAMMRDILTKTRTLADRLMDAAEQRLQAVDMEAVAKTAIASFGSSGESPASTPDPSP